MRTVKEVSKITGISVRTLHYYDEIGLFKPTLVSEAGYRLYDDKALENLQQILFFREFDMPLKEIKAVLMNPDLDKNELLKSQQKLLILKKERLERIIGSIDDILKGENKMDFEVFNKTDIEQLYNDMLKNMTDEQKDIFIKEYGSMEAFEQHFLDSAASPQAQKNFEKVVEWYGDKESAMEAAANPDNPKIMEAYKNRMNAAMEKLVSRMGADVDSLEVKEVVGEIDFVSKQLYQMKDVSGLMLEMADMYLENEVLQKNTDQEYGEGASAFIGRALKTFYKG